MTVSRKILKHATESHISPMQSEKKCGSVLWVCLPCQIDFIDNYLHIDLLAGSFYQDARDVKTKFSKTFTTTFFPVGDKILEIVVGWVRYLRDKMLWGNDDPVFPSTRRAQNSNYHFEVVEIDRKHWSNASPIRKIFKEAFTNAGLLYFNPHSFRNTLVRLGETTCKSPEEFKAWSQNIGHDNVLTTRTSYGEVSRQRQAEILQGIPNPQQAGQPDQNERADAIAQRLIKHGIAIPANSMT